MVETESAFILTLVPKAGLNVLLSVSTSTGFILKRERRARLSCFPTTG
jgi:hypothetical protein